MTAIKRPAPHQTIDLTGSDSEPGETAQQSECDLLRSENSKLRQQLKRLKRENLELKQACPAAGPSTSPRKPLGATSSLPSVDKPKAVPWTTAEDDALGRALGLPECPRSSDAFAWLFRQIGPGGSAELHSKRTATSIRDHMRVLRDRLLAKGEEEQWWAVLVPHTSYAARKMKQSAADSETLAVESDEDKPASE